MNLNSQRVTLLVLLDLSAAFDTVDHGVLLNRVSTSFGVRGSALQWFTSYLPNRSQRVSFDQTLSENFSLQCGVSQRSCLGPLLFTIYASKLFEVIKNYLPQSHEYADDAQLYLSFNADSACSQNEAVEAMEQCIQAIRSWMIKDKLRLNANKTEFMIIGTIKQLAKVNFDGLSVGENIIAPVTSVRNLRSWFDQNLSMIPHINKICKAASFHIYNIRRIRKYLNNDATQTLVHSIVIGRLDYCNSLLYKVPAVHMSKLQRIQNSAARLVCSTPRFNHITPVLFSLHWLPVAYRIEYKILVLTFKAAYQLAPSYICNLVELKEKCKYQLRSSEQLLLPNFIPSGGLALPDFAKLFEKSSFKMADSQTKHVSFEQIFIYIQSENLDKLSKERLQYYCNALKLKVSGDKKEFTQRLEPLAKCKKSNKQN